MMLTFPQAAGKLENHLVELFRNFDIGVKKINSIKLESEKDRRLQVCSRAIFLIFPEASYSFL